MVSPTTVIGKERPYKPSWIDRFIDWVERQSMPAWSAYVLFGLALIAVQLLFLWLEGGLPGAEILPVVIFNSFFTPFLLALIHLLDQQAVMALNSMRPVLETSEAEFDQYEYQLSTMPSPLPLMAGLAVLVLVILMERLWTVPIRYAALEQLPVFSLVFHLVDKSSAFLFGVFIYHTIRQLRLVYTINAQRIRVNLFNLRPLRAFSRLTASTAVGLVVGVYGWMLINPELSTDPLIIGFAVIITILAVSVFLWPLYGVHRQMEFAKEKALHEIDLRFEAIFSQLNRRFHQDDYSEMGMLHGAISSLEIQRRTISAIPTWPWIPETARFALTAIALPLVLAILRFIVERALGW